METCAICGWPIDAKVAEFDMEGKAYHEDCLDENYVIDEWDLDYEDEEEHLHPR